MKRVRGIGSFLFAAVFCYLLVSMIAYMSRNHIAPYEVSEGTIVEDSVYTGVIVRQERSVKSPRSGYLNYYLDDKSRMVTGYFDITTDGRSVTYYFDENGICKNPKG